MWHIFILTWFFQRETSLKKPKFQKVAVPLERVLPTHQYVEYEFSDSESIILNFTKIQKFQHFFNISVKRRAGC